MESTQNHLGLIFNNCLKLQKSLPCYFYHINYSNNLRVRPVGLDRSVYKLSNNTKFIKFGPVDLKLFKFENGICEQFWIKQKIGFELNGPAGKLTGPNSFKQHKGQPTTRPARVGFLAGGGHPSASLYNAKRYGGCETLD